MDNFDLRKYLAEGKLHKENVNEATVLEGFLDKVANAIQGKSDQGAALEKVLQQVIPGFKNGEFIYTNFSGGGGSELNKYNLAQYIEDGRDLNAKFPLPANGFASGDDLPGQAWLRQKVQFNFDAEVPTIQSLGAEAFDILQQKFVPYDSPFTLSKEPVEITPQDMKKMNESQTVTAQIKMVPIADAVKNWPGGTGEVLRKRLAKRQEK
jgi:hypothetical protein